MFRGSQAEKRIGQGMVFGAFPADLLFMSVMKKRFLRSDAKAQYAFDACRSPDIQCRYGDGGFMFEHTGFLTKDFDKWGYAEAYYLGLIASPFILLVGLWFLADYNEKKT